MRDAFHRELDSLDQSIVSMGALVEQSIQLATTALIEGDQGMARRVCEGDDAIDACLIDIEKRSLALVAQQAPVAGDLRLIVAILRVVHDLERAGDLACNVAKLVQLGDVYDADLKGVRSLVADLGQESGRLLSAAINAWASKDVNLAGDIARQDDRIDSLHSQLIQQLMELEGADLLAPAIRLALVGRYFERIGDHAVNLGERVLYFVIGDS